MKISRRRLNQILIEEVQIAKTEKLILKEARAKEIAVEAGMTLLMQMLKSQSGRKKLSSICYAVPDFIKKHLCDLPDSLIKSIANRSGVDQESLLVRVPGGLAAAYKVLCRGGISVLTAPLFVAGFILESVSDEEAEEILSKVPTSSGPQDISTIVDMPDETPVPAPSYEPSLGDAPYGGAYLDDDELEAVLQETMRRLTKRLER